MESRREQEGEILLTTEQVAEMRGMTPKAVSRERQSGRGPKYLRYRNTRVRYRLDDVTAFIEQAEGRTRKSTRRRSRSPDTEMSRGTRRSARR